MKQRILHVKKLLFKFLFIYLFIFFLYVPICIYKLIYLCFRNHMESKAAFNDEITMKDSLHIMPFADYICY